MGKIESVELPTATNLQNGKILLNCFLQSKKPLPKKKNAYHIEQENAYKPQAQINIGKWMAVAPIYMFHFGQQTWPKHSLMYRGHLDRHFLYQKSPLLKEPVQAQNFSPEKISLLKVRNENKSWWFDKGQINSLLLAKMLTACQHNARCTK